MHVKIGTKWSDSRPLTGDDVFYTINLVRDPASAARNGFRTAAQEISKVSQSDPSRSIGRAGDEPLCRRGLRALPPPGRTRSPLFHEPRFID